MTKCCLASGLVMKTSCSWCATAMRKFCSDFVISQQVSQLHVGAYIHNSWEREKGKLNSKEKKKRNSEKNWGWDKKLHASIPGRRRKQTRAQILESLSSCLPPLLRLLETWTLNDGKKKTRGIHSYWPCIQGSLWKYSLLFVSLKRKYCIWKTHKGHFLWPFLFAFCQQLMSAVLPLKANFKPCWRELNPKHRAKRENCLPSVQTGYIYILFFSNLFNHVFHVFLKAFKKCLKVCEHRSGTISIFWHIYDLKICFYPTKKV